MWDVGRASYNVVYCSSADSSISSITDEIASSYEMGGQFGVGF